MSEKLKGKDCFVWNIPVEFLLKWIFICKGSMDAARIFVYYPAL